LAAQEKNGLVQVKFNTTLQVILGINEMELKSAAGHKENIYDIERVRDIA
jgi:hypothetical protein